MRRHPPCSSKNPPSKASRLRRPHNPLPQIRPPSMRHIRSQRQHPRNPRRGNRPPMQLEADLRRHPVFLSRIAKPASRYHIFPCMLASPTTRLDVIYAVGLGTAILAQVVVTRKDSPTADSAGPLIAYADEIAQTDDGRHFQSQPFGADHLSAGLHGISLAVVDQDRSAVP